MKIRRLSAILLILMILSCTREDIIPVESILLPSESIYLKVGESQLLTVTIDPVNASDKGLVWSSVNEDIAKVDANGKVEGLAFGNTFVVVSLTNGTVSDSCQVFVNGTLTGTTGSESLAMSGGYANDVYYSMENGVVATVPRTNWDIAFHTESRSSTIIINSGAGVKLYAFPGGDITSWNSVNTTGIGSWKTLENSDTTWISGAFEQNSKGHPDYGWGVYNALTHDVVGDSLFIIQLQDQSYRKIEITRKASVDNKYIFRYAKIDGSALVIDTVYCAPFPDKNFVFYSLSTGNTIDREPLKASWDFLVTRYNEMIPDGSGGHVPYPVVGVLTNSGIRSATLDNVSVSTTDYSAATFVSSMSEIGSDWKSFDMTLNQWTIKAGRVYFVKDKSLSVYKLVFTGFGGSSTGILEFGKTKLN